MITGESLLEARTAAGLTQEHLAVLLGVSARTVGNWERKGPPEPVWPRVRRVLGDHLPGTDPSPLRSATDAELIAELSRRLARAGERSREALRGLDGLL